MFVSATHTRTQLSCSQAISSRNKPVRLLKRGQVLRGHFGGRSKVVERARGKSIAQFCSAKSSYIDDDPRLGVCSASCNPAVLPYTQRLKPRMEGSNFSASFSPLLSPRRNTLKRAPSCLGMTLLFVDCGEASGIASEIWFRRGTTCSNIDAKIMQNPVQCRSRRRT